MRVKRFNRTTFWRQFHKRRWLNLQRALAECDAVEAGKLPTFLVSEFKTAKDRTDYAVYQRSKAGRIFQRSYADTVSDVSSVGSGKPFAVALDDFLTLHDAYVTALRRNPVDAIAVCMLVDTSTLRSVKSFSGQHVDNYYDYEFYWLLAFVIQMRDPEFNTNDVIDVAIRNRNHAYSMWASIAVSNGIIKLNDEILGTIHYYEAFPSFRRSK